MLVFHASGTDRDIAEKIVEISVVFGIEHLIRTGKTCILKRLDMKLPYGHDTFEHIRIEQ